VGDYSDVYPGPNGLSIVRSGAGRVLAISVGNPGTTHALSSLGGLLVGWCIRENTGAAAATCNLYDGGDSTDTLLAALALPAGAMSAVSFAPSGIDVLSGLFFSTVSGQVRGVVYYQMDTGVPG